MFMYNVVCNNKSHLPAMATYHYSYHLRLSCMN